MSPCSRMLTFLITVTSTLALPRSSAASTIIVDDDGTGDYTTIQAAVDNASPGDTILVLPGTYVEEVVVPIRLTITGSGIGQTKVLPATSRPGTGPGSQLDTTAWLFKVRADDVLIASLTVDGNNPSLAAPIDARGGIVTDFTMGTFNGLRVTNVEVKNVVFRGIYAAAGGTGHSFESNVLKNIKGLPLDSAALFFYGAEGEARENAVDDCSIAIGFHAGGGGTIADNSVTNCDLAALANGSTVAVSIDGNVMTGCDQGIQSIAPSTSVTVAGNQIDQCLNALVFFGLGVGSNLVDQNAIQGGALAGSVGLFASTDVSPYGFGDVHVVATRNLIQASDFGVVLDENASNDAPLCDVVLSSDALLYNTFADSVSFNTYLQGCNDAIDATHNFWGLISAPLIEQTIWHQVDDPLLGLVDFSQTVNLFATVDDDGPADFATINPAVQALLPGGTILVKPGLYVEDVLIDRHCVITGSGAGSNPATATILKGSTISAELVLVTVTGPDVSIENLRVDGEQPVFDKAKWGIYGLAVDGLAVRDCLVRKAVAGVVLFGSTNANLLRNEITEYGLAFDNGGGILLDGSTAVLGAEGSGNYCHDGLAPGILFANGSSGTATGNRVKLAPVGYVANDCGAATAFHRNQSIDCTQGFQAVANPSPVTYTENLVVRGSTGFSVLAGGAGLHTYDGNFVNTHGGNHSLFASTQSTQGNDQTRLDVRKSVLTGSVYGVALNEAGASLPFALDADMNGSGNPLWLTGNSLYDIFLDGCNNDSDARGNYFGTTDSATIEAKIFHQNDDPALGLVLYSGFVPAGPDLRVRGIIHQGHWLALGMTGQTGGNFYMLASLYTGSYNTSYGELKLDPAHLIIVRTGVMPASGITSLEFEVKVGGIPAGLPIYFQGLVLTGTAGKLSNLETIVTS